MRPPTAVQCTACGIRFSTSVSPPMVERVRRCGFCGEPTLKVLRAPIGRPDLRLVPAPAAAETSTVGDRAAD